MLKKTKYDNKHEWYSNGKRHREDGPAVEWPSGHKEWWILGVRITEAEFDRKMKIK